MESRTVGTGYNASQIQGIKDETSNSFESLAMFVWDFECKGELNWEQRGTRSLRSELAASSSPIFCELSALSRARNTASVSERIADAAELPKLIVLISTTFLREIEVERPRSVRTNSGKEHC
jgi:hypothetical protein